MELPNRGPQPQHTPVQGGQTSGGFASNSNNRKKRSALDSNKIWKGLLGLLTICVVVVLLGLLGVLVSTSSASSDPEAGYIIKNDLQAVFLNTGQVYFGNIQKLTNNYVVLTNIFYLQTSSTGSSSTSTNTSGNASNTSVSLVKLGCEIHRPLDQMMINKSEVTFWENLSNKGQVAKAVATYWKQNPNGQHCSTQSSAGTTGQATPQNSTVKGLTSKP